MKRSIPSTKSVQSAAALLFVMTSWSTLAVASEEITIQDLPQEVVKSIDLHYPSSSYYPRAEREVEFGRTDYEVTICHKGQKLEIELTSSGDIIDIDYEGPC